MSRIWLKPEVYPVITCIVGGAAISAYCGVRTLAKHNDITINKSRKGGYYGALVQPCPKFMSREKVLEYKYRNEVPKDHVGLKA